MVQNGQRGLELEGNAREHRAEGDWSTAGELYVAASHTWFGRRRLLANERPAERDLGFRSPKHAAWGVRSLLAGVICFRIAEQPDRAGRYARIGVALVEDLSDHERRFREADARRGLAHEWVGDVRVVGRLEDPEAAYERARQYYDRVDDDLGWLAEEEFEATWLPLSVLASAVEQELDLPPGFGVDTGTLLQRLDVKRRQLPSVVESVVERGDWPVDRL